MKLGNKISGGTVRDCFEVEGHPHLCAKVQRDRIIRDLPILRITVDLKMDVFLLLRFGEADMNVRESRILQELPDYLTRFTPDINMLDVNPSGKTQLIVSRPMNYDGEYSKPLSEHGPLPDIGFWRDIEKIEQFMTRERILGLDIFKTGDNLLAQEVEPDRYRPILIDVKSIGLFVPYVTKLKMVLPGEQAKHLEGQLKDLRRRFYGAAKAKSQTLKRTAMG